MQIMRRRIGQFIRIRPSSLVDPATPIGEIFKEPMGLLLIHAGDDGARFVVYADERIQVVEDELVREP